MQSTGTNNKSIGFINKNIGTKNKHWFYLQNIRTNWKALVLLLKNKNQQKSHGVIEKESYEPTINTIVFFMNYKKNWWKDRTAPQGDTEAKSEKHWLHCKNHRSL